MAEYQAEEYGGITESANYYNDLSSRLLNIGSCKNGDCENIEDSEAEDAWLRLMSAIPVKNQEIQMRSSEMKMPSGWTVTEFVNQLRPAEQNDYSIEHIREKWGDFFDTLSPSESELKQKLKDIDDNWTGDDADAFADQVEGLVDDLKRLTAEIGGENKDDGMIENLRQRETTIASMQGGEGSEGTPYPAVHITTVGDRWWWWDEIHVRPPYIAECQDETCDKADDVAELAGFDTSTVTEVQDWTADRAEYLHEYKNRPEVAESEGKEPGWFTMDMATEQAKDELDQQSRSESDYDPKDDYEARATDLNRNIVERMNIASDDAGQVENDVSPSNDTDMNPEDYGPKPYSPPAGGAPAGGGGAPGTGDYESPTAPGQTPSMPGGGGSGGGPGSPSYPGPGGPGTGPAPGEYDPDDPEGWEWDENGNPVPAGSGSGGAGLASAGGPGAPPGIGGPGGGVPGVGGGPGAGGSGMAGAGPGMGGAGAAGAGAGGGGRGGMMMGGGGGGGGMRGMNDGDKESKGEADAWLVEDDDVWGVTDEDDDPYA
ncbi:hypothetical protein [Haloglycomyces albus]|uniref:hypothetical protein n=1 Tax=Haloglycomyces albus TaxID=526067 RepID=UPI00046D6EA6|nr:hypothetical protein [Haloglycomyces albus]